MKKLVFLLVALITLSFSMNAQDKVIKTHGGFYNTNAVEVVAASNYTFLIDDISAPYLYTYSVALEDESGGNTATVVLAGSLDGINFKTLETVSYTGTGTDTTIISGITSAPVGYSQLRITVTPSDTIWIRSEFLNALPSK